VLLVVPDHASGGSHREQDAADPLQRHQSREQAIGPRMNFVLMGGEQLGRSLAYGRRNLIVSLS
jgi:hypothetical protein